MATLGDLEKQVAELKELDAELKLSYEAVDMHLDPLKTSFSGFEQKMKSLVETIQQSIELRSSLQIFSHTLETDPQQRWHSARKSVDKVLQFERTYQDASQILTLTIDVVVKKANEIIAGKIEPTLKEYSAFCDKVKTVLSQADIQRNAKIKSSKKPPLADVILQCQEAIRDGKACKQSFSFALNAFNEVSDCLEKNTEDMYSQFFQSGYEFFRPSSGSSSESAKKSVMRTFLEDFVDLQLSHTNSIGSLAELSTSVDIPKPDAQVLFGPVVSLLSVHSQLFMSLDKLIKEKPRKSDNELAKATIAALNAALPLMMSHYPDFIQTESAAIPLFARFKANTFPVLKHLPPSFDFVNCRSCSLPHLSQYKSMFESWATLFEGGRETLRLCNKMLDACNAAKKRSESVKPLLQLKDSFTGFDDLVNFYREHVYDGPVCVLPPRGATPNNSGLNPGDTYHVFVFSDCWALTFEHENHYYLLTRGELATGLRVMYPHDGATGVTLALSWKGPTIDVQAKVKPKETSENEKEKEKEKKGHDDKTTPPTTPTTPVKEVIYEHTIMVKFTHPSNDEQDKATRELIRKAYENRWQTRVFGVDIYRLTNKDLINARNPLRASSPVGRRVVSGVPRQRPPSPPPKPVSSVVVPPRFGSARSISPVGFRSTGSSAFDKKAEVPQFLKEMDRVIRENEGYNTVGIFRVSSSTSEMDRMVNAIDCGVYPEMLNPFLAASLIRLWLRRMPEGLLTADLYDEWLSVGEYVHDDAKAISMCKPLIAKLPQGNRVVLSYLLKNIIMPIVKNNAVNKMNSHNVAIVLSPSILRPTETDERDPLAMAMETGRACSVVEFLIDNVTKLL